MARALTCPSSATCGNRNRAAPRRTSRPSSPPSMPPITTSIRSTSSKADRFVSEALRTVLVAFGALAVALTWQSARATMTPSESPQRLIEQLRLAQMAALLLSLTAGGALGIAGAGGKHSGGGVVDSPLVGVLVL